MDPDEALERIRVTLRDVDSISQEEAAARLSIVADLFHGLDGWLSRGGFLPAEWSRSITQ